MIKFQNYEQYKDWVRQAKKQPGILTNCFFLPEAVKERIRRGCLFGEELPDGRALFEKEEGFYRFYYFLDPDGAPAPLKSDLPVVAELACGEELNESQKEQIRILEKMGFTLGRESIRMSLPAEKCVLREPSREVLRLSKNRTMECRKLFERCFDPLYAYLPNEEEWQKAVETGSVFVIVEEDQIRAALFSERRNNTAEIRLVCAEAPFRGKGYASSLVCAYHKAWIGGVKRFFQWLDASNGDAAALYRSFGYEFDRRKAMEYIIR